MRKLFLFLLTLTLILDVSASEAARNRRGKRSAPTRKSRQTKPKVDPVAKAKADRKRAIATKARVFADEVYSGCMKAGTQFGKNEIDANFQARRCFVRVLWGVEKKIVESRKLEGEELMKHVILMNGWNAAFLLNSQEAMNDYDIPNLYYEIYLAKKIQLDLP